MSSTIRDTDIAVIGMSCRFPGAETVEGFWRNLRDGVESITFLQDQDLAVSDPALLANADYVKAAGLLPDIDKFDAGFFGYTTREAEMMDPQQRLMLECAWESLESAGYDPEGYDGLIGIYAGAGMNTYLINNVHPNRGFSPNRTFLESVNDLQVMLSNDKDYLPTRISHKLNLKGPSLNVQTACSTSLVAVHLACQSLLSGECDMALAGGVFLRVPQNTGHLYQEDMIFSSDGHCRAFDARADGTVFSNGGGIVVLKLLQDAIDDGDLIHAVIKGSAINNDGAQKVSYNAPSVEGQARVIAEAQAIAAVDPRTITYVETHGTATKLGDLIEIEALSQAFSSTMAEWDADDAGDGAADSAADSADDDADNNVEATNFCAIGSVKTNIGHLGHAAGMAGLFKSILALKHRQLPPSLHFTTPNPQIDFANSPFYVNHQLTDWAAVAERQGIADTPLRAGVSAFGMGGTNAHVILEEWLPEDVPQETATEEDAAFAEVPHLLALSARTDEALCDLTEKYIAHFTAHPDLNVADVCYTTTTGRHHFPRRLARVGSSLEELTQQLQHYSAQRQDGEPPAHAPTHPQIAFLFTGQGAQYVGMGRDLYETAPTFRAMLDQCDEILWEHLDRSLVELLYPTAEPEHNDLIDSHVCGQTANFALECALAELWRSWGVEPDVVLGHSLGDFAAAYTAGVLSLEEGLQLVATRGRLMATAHGTMISVLASEADILPLIADYDDVTIGVINGPRSVVVSGGRDSIECVAQMLQQTGMRIRTVAVPMAAHSPMLDPVLDDFEAAVRAVTLRRPTRTVVSSMTGQPVDAELTDPRYWRNHLRNTVRYGDGVATLLAQDVRVMLEVGPHPTLLGMAEQTFDALCTPASRPLTLASLHSNRASVLQTRETLAELYTHGWAIDWRQMHAAAPQRRVPLPTYPFQRQRYWINVATELNSSYSTGKWAVGTARPPHPLLGRQVHLAGARDIHFEHKVDPEALAWVADHRVFGTTVLPGTAYAEIALSAGAAIFPSGHFCLQNLRIQQAFTFPDDTPRIMQVVVKPADAFSPAANGNGHHGETHTVQIYSLITETEESDAPRWRLHATGQLMAAEAESPPHTLAFLQTLCRTKVPVEQLYDRFAQQGIEYGSSYRTMQSVWREKNLALGRIALPIPISEEAPQYRLHPALLDACTQVLEALVTTDPLAQTFVPVGMERFTIFAQPEASIWSAVHLRPADPQQPELMTADFHLFQEDGTLVAILDGFQLKEASQQSMFGAEEDPQSWLYTVQWREQAAPAETAESATHPWLIFADQSGIAPALQAHLEAAGQPCIRVNRGSGFQQHTEREFTVDPYLQETMQRLLATLAHGTQPLRGVVHLWSVDDPGIQIDGTTTAVDVMASVQRGTASSLHLLHTLTTCDGQVPPIWLVTQGAQAVVEEDALAGVAQSPVWGMRKVITLEHPDVPLACIDLDTIAPTQAAAQLAAELTQSDGEEQVAYRHGTRYVARLARYEQAKATAEWLALPDYAAPGSSFRLEMVQSGLLEHLTLQPTARRQPARGEIEIRVHAAGLNFRDVLYALDMNALDLPLGAECAGRVTAVGDGVTDFAVGDAVIAYVFGSMGLHVTVDAHLAAPKPANLSFIEAATIPAAFLTAYYAFQSTELAAGERVLIHAATGGVGQAAIQLAHHLGAEVLGTASQSKWPVLKSCGVAHPMNSRTLEFATQTMEQTEGRGVDVVLNSLTGAGFVKHSLSTLADGGRFLELSKREIWTPEQVKATRSDVQYSVLDIAELSRHQPERIGTMLRSLVELFESGALRPIPQTVYPIQEAIAAFQTMQRAKHTGKVVLTLPDSTEPTAATKQRFSSEATYLITGGFGGLGLVIARWMVEQGARHLVLTGRRGATPAAQPTLEALRAMGASIYAAAVDVTDGEQLAGLLRDMAEQGPPLRGILHAAGVLDDGIFQQLTWSRFEPVLRPKVVGAWHLHQLTQHIQLDFFVLFSSLTALIGNAGQANHAAANAFLDALAHRRQAQGLPALSINWGGWTEVGAAATQHVEEHLAAQGIGGITPTTGLQLLDQLLRATDPQIGVSPIYWPRFLAERMGAAHFFADFAQQQNQHSGQRSESDAFLNQWAAATAAERTNLTVRLVRTQVAKVLGEREAASLGRETGFFDLGMDSLTSIELRNRLQATLGFPLPATLAFDHPTLDTLVTFLGEKLVQHKPESAQPQPAVHDWQKQIHSNGDAGHRTESVSDTGADPTSPAGDDTSLDDMARRLAEQLAL